MEMNYIDKLNILKITITNFDYENEHKVTLFSNQDESSYYTSNISYLKSIGKTQNHNNKGVRLEVIGYETFNMFQNMYAYNAFTIYEIIPELNYKFIGLKTDQKIDYIKKDGTDTNQSNLDGDKIFENPITIDFTTSLITIIPKAISNDKPSILNLNIRIEKQINNSNQLVGLHPVNCYKKEKMLLF